MSLYQLVQGSSINSGFLKHKVLQNAVIASPHSRTSPARVPEVWVLGAFSKPSRRTVVLSDFIEPVHLFINCLGRREMILYIVVYLLAVSFVNFLCKSCFCCCASSPFLCFLPLVALCVSSFVLRCFCWSIIVLVCLFVCLVGWSGLVGSVWFCFVWFRLFVGLVCLFGLLQVHCTSRLLELETVPSHPGGWPFECWECSALTVHGATAGWRVQRG